jgi:hypothetical protein
MKRSIVGFSILAAFFLTSLMVVGCVDPPLSGTYRYEEFSKPESGQGVTFGEADLVFNQLQYTLEVDDEEVQAVEEDAGVYQVNGDGSMSFSGGKGVFDAYYSLSEDLIVMPSMLPSPARSASPGPSRSPRS